MELPLSYDIKAYEPASLNYVYFKVEESDWSYPVETKHEGQFHLSLMRGDREPLPIYLLVTHENGVTNIVIDHLMHHQR
jgi:hypothetical protein